jgi:hypothetical protein
MRGGHGRYARRAYTGWSPTQKVDLYVYQEEKAGADGGAGAAEEEEEEEKGVLLGIYNGFWQVRKDFRQIAAALVRMR